MLQSRAPTSGQKEAREGIHTQTPREAARQTAKRGEPQRKPRNKYSDRDRYRRAKARRRIRLQLRDATPTVFPHRLADEGRRANCPEASVFHDGFKTCALAALPGRLAALGSTVCAALPPPTLLCSRTK